jgi:hypothetical protein
MGGSVGRRRSVELLDRLPTTLRVTVHRASCLRSRAAASGLSALRGCRGGRRAAHYRTRLSDGWRGPLRRLRAGHRQALARDYGTGRKHARAAIEDAAAARCPGDWRRFSRSEVGPTFRRTRREGGVRPTTARRRSSPLGHRQTRDAGYGDPVTVSHLAKVSVPSSPLQLSALGPPSSVSFAGPANSVSSPVSPSSRSSPPTLPTV